MSRTTAEATIGKLRESWSRWGIPKQVVSDNGPPFTSGQFRTFLQRNGIHQMFSAPYHPASNGAAENAVKTIKNVLKKRDGIDPELAIQRYLLVYHNTPHCATGESPARLLQGRHLRTRLDIVKPEHGRKLRNKEHEEVEKSKDVRQLRPGDSVWYRNYGVNDKWSAGQVAERLGTNNYSVRSSDGSAAHRHVDQLKRKSSCVFPSEVVVDASGVAECEQSAGACEPQARVGDVPAMTVGQGQVDASPATDSGLPRRSQRIRFPLEEDGFLVLENFLWPEECNELQTAGLEFTTKLPDIHERSVFSTTDSENKHAKDTYFLESNDKIRPFFEEASLDANGELAVPASVSLNKVGHALHLLHPLFRCYTYCDRVKSICAELELKEPAVVQSMLIYKNPGIGGEVTPHQDATFLYTSPIPPIGFWIALEDATIQNGCLWIARGSHKSGVHRRMLRNPDKDSKGLLIYDKPAPIYPESSFKPVPVKKGTCIILHGHVVHKSANNKSDSARPAYTFHVVEQNNNEYAPENWLQEGPAAPFVNLYTTTQLM